MVNVHGLYITHGGGACPTTMKWISKHPFKYTYGVGFGIAYLQQEGNARALNAG